MAASLMVRLHFVSQSAEPHAEVQHFFKRENGLGNVESALHAETNPPNEAPQSPLDEVTP